MFIVDKLVIYVCKFKIILLPHFIIVIIVGKISKMNWLYYGVLDFFLINFIISEEMTSFSLDNEG